MRTRLGLSPLDLNCSLLVFNQLVFSFRSLLADVFPGVDYSGSMMDDLRREIQKVCEEKFLACGMKEDELGYIWTEKVCCVMFVVCLISARGANVIVGSLKKKNWYYNLR